MTSDTNDIISFGKYLKKLRIEKGLDLSDIAFETRISMKVLRDIEAENFGGLPNQTVLKGFLRTYADALGADRELLVKSYITAAKGEGMSTPSGVKKRNVGLMLLLLFICMAAVFYLMNQDEGIEVKDDPLSAVGEDTAKALFQGLNPEPLGGNEQKAPERHLLSITTVEETIMKIVIDAQPPKEFSLAPGDHLELEAAKGFNILLNNASGVNLKFNGKPVHVSGRSGQDVNISLP